MPEMWVAVGGSALMGLLFGIGALILAWRWLTHWHRWTAWVRQNGFVEVEWQRGGGRPKGSVLAAIEARSCQQCYKTQVRTVAAKNQPGWPDYVPEERRERTMTTAK
jgi:hypothetical protein